jgi:hypothetical protein
MHLLWQRHVQCLGNLLRGKRLEIPDVQRQHENVVNQELLLPQGELNAAAAQA